MFHRIYHTKMCLSHLFPTPGFHRYTLLCSKRNSHYSGNGWEWSQKISWPCPWSVTIIANVGVVSLFIVGVGQWGHYKLWRRGLKWSSCFSSYGHTSAHSCHKCPTVLPSSHGRQVSNTFEDFLWLLIILWLLVSTHPNRMWFNWESSSKTGMGNHIPNHQSRTFSANEKHCFVNPPHRRVPRCFFVHTSSIAVATQF